MRRGSQAGFSLIEILVVVFIIGVILGFASLNLGGRSLDDKLEQEARRVHRLFSLARDEASLTGMELGWRLSDAGHQFLALSEQGWVPYADSGPLRARTLEPPLQMRLYLEQESTSTEGEITGAPQLIFFSSGELTPFELRMGAADLPVRYSLTGNLLGQLKLERIASDGLYD